MKDTTLETRSSLDRIKTGFSRVASSGYFRLILGLLISFVTLLLALRDVELQEVWVVLSGANLGFVGLVLVSVAVNALAKAVRWGVLILPSGKEVSLFKLLMTLLVSQILNMFIPGRVGDLGRAYVVGGMGPGRSFVLGTVVLEKLLDLIAYASLFFVLLLLFPLPSWVGQSAYTLAGVAVLIAVALVITTSYRGSFMRLLERIVRWLPPRFHQPLLPRLRAGFSSLEILESRADLLKIALWTGVVWGTAVLNNHLALLALDLHLPVTASLLLLIALQAGISLSAVPGTIGVFEYLCVLTLSTFGVDPAVAFGYGVMLHAIILLPALLAGALSFWLLGLRGEKLSLFGAAHQD